MEGREYLKEMCNTLQYFMTNDKKILVINMPPRHGKSRTAQLLAQWLFGKNNKLKIMTGSYNETLSSSFAKQVRDSINETDGMFECIFPATQIKRGEASASKWALEGSEEANYLATSPTGTATGFGCNVMIIDDLIKNAEEAYNELTLEKQLSWFSNTMLSRAEKGFKIIIIMTRWCKRDLAGSILDTYPPEVIEHINFRAINKEDNTMLCEDILSKEDYDFKTKEMNIDIVEANYNQEPMDVKGKLYTKYKTYSDIPKFNKIKAYIDTADKGADYLCAIVYAEYNLEVYILDILFTDEGMEITEELTAEFLFNNSVNLADVESNNGGRGFARNVERILKEKI